jgi:DNA-binding protein YbaB
MFNKLKQYKDLRSQAKSIQETLANETVTTEKGGVKVVMDGNMKVVSLKIGEDVAKESLESTITDCINDAIKKTQKLMAQKMQEMGGMPGMQQ